MKARALPAGVYPEVPELLRLAALAQGLTLRTRRQSRSLAHGPVRTRYKGRGMEFAEVRPYRPGDDIRTIDWRVTARMQEPYTKLFQEEHERPVLLLVDLRAAMFFGSTVQFKSALATRLAVLIGWIAQQNGDRCGALVVSDERQREVRARRGKHAVLELIHQLHDASAALSSPVNHAGPPLAQLLTDAARVARPGGLIVLISDWHDFSDACAEPLSRLRRTSDVLAFQIFDPLEAALPNRARLAVTDGHHRSLVDTQQLGAAFSRDFEQRQQQLTVALTGAAIPLARAATTDSLEQLGRDLFHPRAGGRR